MSSLINFSGLASGIDSSSLIAALTQASRKQLITPYEKQITSLTETDDALETLKEKFETLQSILRNNFSTLAGGSVSKQAVSSNEIVASASASNAATSGTYRLTVNDVASNGNISFSQSYGSTSALVGSAGTVVFTLGSGSSQETINLTVNASTTISQLVSEFNSSSTLGRASLINIGSSSNPDYRITVSTNNTGLEKGQIAVNNGTVTELDAKTIDQATNADFNLNGINNIIRQSNTVGDVVTGLTFNMNSLGSSTITVSQDSKVTQSKVQEFVDAFNDIVKFIRDNNNVIRDESGDEVENIYQALAATNVDDTSLSALRSALSGTSCSSGSAVKIFADLGITTERDGTLKFDTTTFASAIAEDPDSVQELLTSFADTTSTTGGIIDSIVRFNGSLDITINSNKSLIESLNKRIIQAKDSITQQEDTLRARFARLEATISKMQSQQQALTGLLRSLA